jgi:nicotinate phosphoribosyltransferase
MKSAIPKTHLFLPEDLHLYDLPQIFSASALWFESGMKDQIATFDLIIRDMPPHRNFLLFGGLEEIIEEIRKWQYSDEEIQALLESKIITEDFAKYLKTFKFTGTICAMKEGTVFFPGEPMIRVTAPLIEANLLTMFLMNTVTGNTKFLTKIIRPVIAAAPKLCLGVAGLRADSFESAMKCARAAYIAGAVGSNSVPSFSRKFNLETIQPLTVAYHAVIKSFPTEIEAMRKMSDLFNGKISLMVDTYEFTQGVKNTITVAKELKQKNVNLYGIMIDSGDLLKLSIQARRMLDEAGLKNVKITVASNLDEYKIKELSDKKIPADAFLIATEAVAVPDAPKLETVYKLAELRKDNKITYCAKFAPRKESYPAKKQVFRVIDKNGIFSKDIIGIENENLGQPLLMEVIKDGKVVYNLPKLDEIKEFVKSQIQKLPKKLLAIDKQHKFKVEISKKLKQLFEKIKKDHCISTIF